MRPRCRLAQCRPPLAVTRGEPSPPPPPSVSGTEWQTTPERPRGLWRSRQVRPLRVQARKQEEEAGRHRGSRDPQGRSPPAALPAWFAGV